MTYYKVQVWIEVEEENPVDAAAAVDRILNRAIDRGDLGEAVQYADVDWDSVEEVEDEYEQ